jgi:predicted protein tyrosine phosphatase
MRIRISDIDSVTGLMNHCTHVVSLVDTRGGIERLPKVAFNNPNWHICVMDDLEEEVETQIQPKPHAPSFDDLQNILAFTREIGEDDILLVHCHAGLCRSTAVAFLAMVQHGATFEPAMTLVLKQRPHAWPNMRIITLGDRVLGLAGRAAHFMHNWQARHLSKTDLKHFT